MPFLSTRPLLLLAGTLSATQIAAPSQVLLHSDPQSRNCPITISAQPRYISGLMPVPSQTAHRDRAGVHLRLEDPDGRPIRSAEVTLHGVAAVTGAQPASFSNSTDTKQPTQTFHVVSGRDTAGVLTADLWLAHAVTIRSVSVTAVDFASAPAWQASEISACIAVPSGNRLLGSLR